jgi:hypothetical protein
MPPGSTDGVARDWGLSVKGKAMYEVRVNGRWVKVAYYEWRSWTGLRRLAGKDFHGPVVLLGTTQVIPATQARECHGCARQQWGLVH